MPIQREKPKGTLLSSYGSDNIGSIYGLPNSYLSLSAAEGSKLRKDLQAKEVKSLKTLTENLERENTKLTNDLRKSNKEIERLQKECSTWESRSNELEKLQELREPAFLNTSRLLYEKIQILETSEQMLRDLQSKTSRLEQFVDDSTEALYTSRAQCQVWELRCKELERLNNEVESEKFLSTSTISRKNEQLRACLVEFSDRLNEKNEKIANLESKLEIVEKMNGELQSELERLRTRDSQNNIDILSYESKCHELETEKDGVQAKVNQLDLDLQRVRYEAEHTTDEKLRIAKRHDEVTEQLEQVQSELQATKVSLTKITETDQRNKGKIAQLTKVLKKKDETIADLELGLEKLRESHVPLQCIRCQVTYTHASNMLDSVVCEYHSGTLIPRPFPLQGMTWSCCHKVGSNAKPCCRAPAHICQREFKLINARANES
eukprot:g3620.t1